MLKIENWELNNGVKIPAVGAGTYKATRETISLALKTGYRHIDIAPIYGNEAEVGEAIADSGISRSELFLSVKVWNDHLRTGDVREAVEQSMQNLHTDYLDLLLFHWPVKDKYVDAWLKMEELYREGRVKAIGVSNCTPRQIEELKMAGKVVPAVNQIEIHPKFTQDDVVGYCRDNGIAVQSWSPLGGGNYVNDPVLHEIGTGYGKTAAQTLLRWNLQRGCIVIPKASTLERLRQNAEIFDFSLTAEEMSRINQMNLNIRTGSDPENFDF